MRKLLLTGVAALVGIGAAVIPSDAQAGTRSQTMTVTQNPSGKWRLVVVQTDALYWGEVNTVLAEMRNRWNIPITWGKCTGREVSCISLSFYSADDGAYGWGTEGMVKFNLRPDRRDSQWRREVVWHEFGHALGLPHNENPADKCQTSMAGGCEHSHGWYVYGYTPTEYQKVQNFLSR